MRRASTLLITGMLAVLIATPAVWAQATRAEDALWANGVTWDTILTPTSFNAPPSHSIDKLWDFAMSGLMGQRSVAEAAPGDRDYNGGRWQVMMVVFTEAGLEAHDPDGDGFVNFELTSDDEIREHIDLGHITSTPTETYFECPLLRSN